MKDKGVERRKEISEEEGGMSREDEPDLEEKVVDDMVHCAFEIKNFLTLCLDC